ncbi:hypothetical protein AHF37_01859 [Paragonimus kellicotti]|nr:hypothetical protein AHF37_01859 [Paragonimus kellicotti]
MTMLFRYHSSVCLAICSVRIYEDEVTRYECVLRRIKKDTITTFVQNNLCGPLNLWKLLDGVRQQSRHGFFKTQPHLTPICQLAIRKCSSVENIRTSHDMDCLQTTQVDSRQDTITNLEMARIRVIATEVNHRILGFKLIQSREEQRPHNKDISGTSNQIFGKSNYNLSSDKEARELRVNPQLGFLK